MLGRASSIESILDIGCGAHVPLLRRVDVDRRVGTDLRSWGEWRDAPVGIDVVVHKIELGASLPFRDETFDAVTLLAVLEHLSPGIVAFLMQDIRRVLRSGGRVVVTTPPRRTDRLLPLLGKLGLISRESPAEHQATYSEPELDAVLTDAGFSAPATGKFELGMNLWASAVKTG